MDNGANKTSANSTTKIKRGFALLNRERLAEIASLGGVAAHAKGTAHEFTVDEARAAGRKGGLATAKRKGGTNGVQTQR